MRLGSSLAINAPRRKAAGGDPYWANVSALFHFDGTNGSTTFTDSGPVGITLSDIYALSSLVTTPVKFGSASVLLPYDPGSTNTGVLAGNAPGTQFAMGSGDYTIEGWVYVDFIGGDYIIFSLGNPFTDGVGAYINVSGSVGIRVANVYYNSTTSATAAAWNHFAVVCSGSVHKLYWNGVLVKSSASVALSGTNTAFKLGNDVCTENMYVDEVRITKGVARYSGASFTVPTAAFPNS